MLRTLIVATITSITVAACGIASAHSSSWHKGYTYAQSHLTAFEESGEASWFWCMNMAMQFDWFNGNFGTQWEDGCTAALNQ